MHDFNETYKKLHGIVMNPNEYSKEEQEKAFILLKFYNNPVQVLGKDDSPSSDDYEDLANYDLLFLNNDFLSLLDEGLEEDELFTKKLTISMLRKAKFLIFDGIECKRGFIPNVIDKYKEASKKLEIAFQKKDEIAYVNALAEVVILKRALKYSQYSEQDVNKFNNSLANYILCRVDGQIYDLCSRVGDMQENKEQILSMIEKQYYTDGSDNNFYLEMYTTDLGLNYDQQFVRAVVLENRFTSIVEKLLDENGMSAKMIKTAIEALGLGMRIKKHQLYLYELCYKTFFSHEEIRNFDIDEAQRVTSKLVATLAKMETKKLWLVKKN